MSLWVKVLVVKADTLSSTPGTHSRRRNLISTSRPLSSITVYWHTLTHQRTQTHTNYINIILKIKQATEKKKGMQHNAQTRSLPVGWKRTEDREEGIHRSRREGVAD